ncbi:aldo/keto reductase [Streptomyces sp. NPDC090025]|uniref:aldo/keto reductase n=1 Tax=Streptomyces sp. NPDC090025 TaxID=3365922 RepID=UPI0038341456
MHANNSHSHSSNSTRNRNNSSNSDVLPLRVFPLCLGGSVFGWTADTAMSHRVLDRYAEAGGNFLDTADSYSQWAPGNEGGESERVIGAWLAGRPARDRDRMVIATKAGRSERLPGLDARTVRRAAQESLRRLGVDRIDLFYAHIDDAAVPFAETLGALDELVREGLVGRIGVSNISGPRLAESLAAADAAGLPRYGVLQTPYNLVRRAEFEGGLLPVCRAAGLATVPYFALEQGFLTGKYREGRAVPGPREAAASAPGRTPLGRSVLAALDEIAADRGTAPAAVALAWLAAQPTVLAPLASARTPAQLTELLAGAALTLTPAELASLDLASLPPTVKECEAA